MSSNRGQLTSRDPATATPQATVDLSLTPADVELLLRLRDAGLIDLDLDELENRDPRLTSWTLDAFESWMCTQGAPSTAYTYRCYLATLANHAEAPVELHPPDEDAWIEHIAYQKRRGRDGATLNNYRHALMALLRYLEHLTGRPIRWGSLDGCFKTTAPEWDLPPDDLVADFWLRERPADRRWLCNGHVNATTEQKRITARTLAYIMHAGFHVGMRPPSEICALDVPDFQPDHHEGPRLMLTEAKKGNRRRPVPLPDYVATGRNCKSLQGYLDHVRPQLDQGTTDALFLDWDGERWGRGQLTHQLRSWGRQIWPDFTPYTMRHWFATRLLVAIGDISLVADRLGDTIATVERHYVAKAEARRKRWNHQHLPRLIGGGNP